MGADVFQPQTIQGIVWVGAGYIFLRIRRPVSVTVEHGVAGVRQAETIAYFPFVRQAVAVTSVIVMKQFES